MRSILQAGCAVLWFLLLPDYNGFAQTNVSGGTVSGTWTKAGSPYIIAGDISVPANEKLTLEPGTKVLFTGYFKLIVQGSLDARGLPGDSIVFDRFGSQDDWHSIRVQDVDPGSDSTLLEYCRIEHTRYPEGTGVQNGGGNALLVNGFHRVRISNCLLRNNSGGRGGGVYAINSNIRIHNNTIRKNNVIQFGGGICVEGGAASIRNNLIESNYAGDKGGGIWLSGTGSRVEGNRISYNHSYWAGGGVVIQSEAYVSRNLISYNESEHDDGGGLVVGASPKIINNTIVFNRAEHGEGVSSGGSPQFINNIIYYNRDRYGQPNENDEIYLMGNGPSFFNCDIEGGVSGIVMYSGAYAGTAQKILDAPPLFANPSKNDMRLTWSHFPTVDMTMSPCIDGGTQDSAHDPDGSTSDIGAYYYHQSAGSFPAHADFVADTLFGYNSLEVRFTDRSLKGSSVITEWRWDFGDGGMSTAQHPVHQYNTSGLFSVMLTIKDANGIERSVARQKYIQIIDGVYLKGKISGTLAASRYIVAGDLLVEEAQTLTVASGAQFLFTGPYKLEVRGALEARGTAQQPIVFTSYDVHTPVRWSGLYLYASGPQDSTILDHCIVQYVGPTAAEAILAFSENGAAGMRISNSEVSYNTTRGIQVTTSHVLVRNNYIHHNTSGIYRPGAGLYIPAGAPKIINNIISYNESSSDGGGICVDWDARPSLINNAITNNKGFRGGGIADFAGWIELINNTIAFNTATTGLGAGYYVLYAGDIKFTNCILWNNFGMQVYVDDPYSRVGFKNSFLQGGSSNISPYPDRVYLYENVLTVDPLLASGINRHGTLLPGSPAVDAGTNGVLSMMPAHDVLGNSRILNSLIDIGAYEYVASAPVETLNPIADVTVAEEFAPFTIPLGDVIGDSIDPRFVIFGIQANPTKGLKASVTSNEIRISPEPDQWGDVVITFTVSTPSTVLSTSFVVHITPVDDLPKFSSEGNVTTTEDFAGQRAYVVNARVPYGEETQIRTLSLQPSTSDLVDIQFTGNMGAPVFTAKPNRFGSQRFTLTLTEGLQTYAEVFNFTVKSVNDAPVISAPQTISAILKDSVFVPVSVTDVDGDAVEFGGYLANNNIAVWSASINPNEFVLLVIGQTLGTSSIILVATDGMEEVSVTIPVSIALVTGVEAEIPTLTVYPNPTPGVIHISGKTNSLLTLYTVRGESVMQATMNSAETRLDLSQLSPGIYLLQVDDGANKRVVRILKR